jgi:hypothetical protein
LSTGRIGRLLFFCLIAIHPGCIPKVDFPIVDHISVQTGAGAGDIDVGAYENQLLADLYHLLKTNEASPVAICEASKTSRQCTKTGVSVFVLGGIIPGIGKREHYVFRNISLEKNQLTFTKDNNSTEFIGTPMYTRENYGKIWVKNGGLQVEMTRYYANWAGIGNMAMAEGWAIDYIDFNKGIVGLQLELEIAGLFTLGGGSKYVLLKFPTATDILSRSYEPS